MEILWKSGSTTAWPSPSCWRLVRLSLLITHLFRTVEVDSILDLESFLVRLLFSLPENAQCRYRYPSNFVWNVEVFYRCQPCPNNFLPLQSLHIQKQLSQDCRASFAIKKKFQAEQPCITNGKRLVARSLFNKEKGARSRHCSGSSLYNTFFRRIIVDYTSHELKFAEMS